MRKLIDLHLHLDGSVPFTTIKKLMNIHGLPTIDVEVSDGTKSTEVKINATNKDVIRTDRDHDNDND